MEKQYYFFDLDDTLFKTKNQVIKYLNSTYKVDLNPEQYHCGNSLFEIVKSHNTNINISLEEFWDKYRIEFLMSSAWHREVEPMENMVDFVKKLSERHYCDVVTARQSPGVHVVQKLLEKYIPNCIRHIHFVNQYDKGVLKKVLKNEYIKQFADNSCMFVDDNLGEFEMVKDMVPSYLFDPSNHHPEVASSMKFSNWTDIGEKVL